MKPLPTSCKPCAPQAHWLALLGNSACSETQRTLAWWALQFTPRVVLLEEAVVLELGASLRLFGGLQALHRRLCEEARPLGLQALAWAPSSLAALALARALPSLDEAPDGAPALLGLQRPLQPLLDALPLRCLSAVALHAPMLERLGCRRLGQVRALPRTPTARRFGEALLLALDQALGRVAQAHDWVQAPEQFEARLELPFRVEQAQALSQHAELLLQRLCAWLAARHAGVRQLSLCWQHDAMRSREAGSGGRLQLHTADATRDFRHLARLLHEHLARLELQAPVGELSLHADTLEALAPPSASLLPEDGEGVREPLGQLLERLSVRLGAECVRQARLREDHRPECQQDWQPWDQCVPLSASAEKLREALRPQPSWLLQPPLALHMRQDQPLHEGRPLQLLAGPQRIEGGWWSDAPAAQRDYYLARSASAALLWVYLERPAAAQGQPRWYWHGVFA